MQRYYAALPNELQLIVQIEQFTLLIDRQARCLFQQVCNERGQTPESAIIFFGTTYPQNIRYVGVWEDHLHNQWPPKIIGECDTVGTDTCPLTFEVAIGALHNPEKQERIFELCMLRAEAFHELLGTGGDGHVLERMTGLVTEIHRLQL